MGLLNIRSWFDRKRLFIFVSGLLFSILMAGVYIHEYLSPSLITRLDLKVYDTYLEKYHTTDISPVPVIVDLDEKSLAQFGQWPWPRYRVARLVKGIMDQGAASVAMDMVFAEPDRVSIADLIDELREDLGYDLQIQGLPDDLPSNDEQLAQVLEDSRCVLGIVFNTDASRMSQEQEGTEAEEPCNPHHANVMLKYAPGLTPKQARTFFTQGPYIICNEQVLQDAVEYEGFFNTIPDIDGVIRRTPLLMARSINLPPQELATLDPMDFAFSEDFYYSLSLASLIQTLEYYTGKRTNVMVKSNHDGVEYMQIGSDVITLDSQANLLLQFKGPGRTFPYVSAADILNGTLEPETLKDKIVFIGTSSPGLKDLRSTVFDTAMPGVEVHATVVDNILQQDFIIRPGYASGVEFGVILFVGLITTMLLLWARAIWSMVPIAIMGFGLWHGGGYLFDQHHLYLSPLFPIATLIGVFTILSLVKFWREEQEKQFFHSAFSKYVSKAVVDQVTRHPDKLSLTGEEKEVTILFSDIRSFTTMSETLTPEQVSQLLKAYFTPMTEKIIETNGTLDKFIGDAIMAFWNAPLDVKHHQKRGVESALGMLSMLKELNPQFKKDFNLELAIGVGLHSGMVRVGNMGSDDLFDYTVLGDSVNLASRLEGLTKFYGLGLIVSDSIKHACDGSGFVFQEIDKVRVKGKHLPITIHTVYSEDQAKELEEELGLYTKALHLYHAQAFSEAGKVFTALFNDFRPLLMYKEYQNRCMELIANAPGEGWDFVFTHRKK